jgi:murein L,D-transpeptidase YafK
VALGKRPIGAKRERGDWRTPEGEYFVTYRKPVSRYHRFLGLSYPNIEDAEEGLRRGAITAEELWGIRTAIGARTQPSWTTRLGSGVGIHGEGDYGEKKREDAIDWTDGCIALSDDDVEILFDLVPTGTPVAILP